MLDQGCLPGYSQSTDLLLLNESSDMRKILFHEERCILERSLHMRCLTTAVKVQ